MSDSFDLRYVLKSWPYDPDKDMRLVRGDDGRQVLQIRTPLGVEQYELDGRPDGTRPHGMETVLEYYTERLEELRKTGRETDFELDAGECGELFNEGTLYYFRYVRLFQLKDWPRTIRDTARNLWAFDFIHRYAQREEDQMFLEKWRPYVLRVNASAAAMHALETGGYRRAVEVLTGAIRTVETLEEIDDETFRFERDRSLLALRELLDQVQSNRPLSEVERLEQQLRRAIDKQEFEEAAQLRDRIKAIRRQQVA